MNLSGEAVQAISHYFKIPPDQMLIAHDDMDITLSEYKLHFDKGPKLHNGIDSVERLLGSTAFWRLRIGIEHRPVRGNKGIPGLTYALERFSQDELATVQTTFQTLIEQSFRGRAPRAPEYS
jgi:PTH1 family peptidyl-tRNA hydrolase